MILAYLTEAGAGDYADALSEEFEKAADQLIDFPRSGRVVPELRRESVRELIIGDYRLVYVIADVVKIILIVHGARDVTDQIRRLHENN